MKVFVTGAEGYIGKSLVKSGFHPLVCNVTEYNDVERAVAQAHPDLIVHLAGKSDPDVCETHIKDAIRVNVDGTHNVFEAAVKYKIPAVLLSSSQIWGGGWRESLFNKHAENSRKTIPVNSYGTQKVVAEFVVDTSNMNGRNTSKIIRTSYIFNRERLAPDLKKLRLGLPVDAPRFLKRSFIHMDAFVLLLTEYCKRFDEMPPVLHLAGSETVSYYTFWQEIARQFGYSRKLVKGRWIEKNNHPAKRPHNGGLDVSLSQSLGFPSFDYIGGIERMKGE
jgi:dTDP-4-dehydrorhamnose reductase